MKNFWILAVFIQFIYPAFETAFKFQHLDFDEGNFSPTNSADVFQTQNSFGIIFPFGKSFLNLTTYNYQKNHAKGIFQIYLVTSGDKLNRETMLESQIRFRIHKNYHLGIILDSYLISIKNYSTHSLLSTGLQLSYHSAENFAYIIESKIQEGYS